MASTWLRSSSLHVQAPRAPSKMAGDASGPPARSGRFGGDHRERDVRARMVRVFGDAAEGDRRAVLDGE